MTITVDWQNKLVLSDASIPDIVAFKDTLRDFEDDIEGMLFDPIITYKKLDIGGGAFFHGVELINGYQLQFPAGNWTITGNIGGTVVPVAGVYLERVKSAAFATFSTSSGSGMSTEEQLQLRELWQLQGLDIANPMTVTPTARDTGTVTQDITGDGTTTTTVTRT